MDKGTFLSLLSEKKELTDTEREDLNHYLKKYPYFQSAKVILSQQEKTSGQLSAITANRKRLLTPLFLDKKDHKKEELSAFDILKGEKLSEIDNVDPSSLISDEIKNDNPKVTIDNNTDNTETEETPKDNSTLLNSGNTPSDENTNWLSSEDNTNETEDTYSNETLYPPKNQEDNTDEASDIISSDTFSTINETYSDDENESNYTELSIIQNLLTDSDVKGAELMDMLHEETSITDDSNEEQQNEELPYTDIKEEDLSTPQETTDKTVSGLEEFLETLDNNNKALENQENNIDDVDSFFAETTAPENFTNKTSFFTEQYDDENITSGFNAEVISDKEKENTKEENIENNFFDLIDLTNDDIMDLDGTSQQEIIDDFLAGNQKPSFNPKDIKEDKTTINLSEKDKKILPASESLARIMAQQGLINDSIGIYKRLMLKYPEKKTYFALQIEKLLEK